MALALIAAVLAGGFFTTMALWTFRFGVANVEASDRLQRLRTGAGEAAIAGGPSLGLRKRTAVNFGGLTLVSGTMAKKWATQLDRAGLTLNVREFLMLRVAVGLVLSVVILMFVPFPLLAVAGMPLGFFITGFWVGFRERRRMRMFESQLVELLSMMASALRAGFGLLQALESAAEQLPAPISVEVRRTLRDVSMGASVETALQTMNERVGGADFDIVVTAILIQRSVGGNLAEILDTVAHTMRERERIRGEIATLTAQQRMTGMVLGMVPVGLFVVLYMMNPEFTGLLFTDPWGRMMLGLAVVLEGMGFLVIRKIVNIEV